MKYPEFRALEDRGSSSKADDLLIASITGFCSLVRPARSDAQQLEDLAIPLLSLASARVRRHAAAALSELPHAPKGLIMALAREEVAVSAPLLLRSPLLETKDLADIIARGGLPHARVIARRRNADAALLDLLHGFNDPAIERALQIRAYFSNAEEEQDMREVAGPESPRLRDTREALKALMRAADTMSADEQLLADRLIDAALLEHTETFHGAFAESLGLQVDAAVRVIGHGLNAELTIALASLGLSAEAAHLVLTGLFGLVHKDLHSLRLFVQSYRQIDQDRAQAAVERWRTEANSQQLRKKLREMADDFERGGKPTRKVS